ncbi:hypothetical protein BMR04_14840, partial [Methylococcaceae bacterium HT3]
KKWYFKCTVPCLEKFAVIVCILFDWFHYLNHITFVCLLPLVEQLINISYGFQTVQTKYYYCILYE